MNEMAEPLRPQDDAQPLDVPEFARTSGIDEGEVRELMDYGLLQPAQATQGGNRLDLHTALMLREAARLRRDFDLDLFTTGLLARYLGRIHDLEGQVSRLRAQGSARTVYSEVVVQSVVVRSRGA